MWLSDSEFCFIGESPRRGLTSVEAEHLLRQAFPEVERWLCWEPEKRLAERGLCRIPVGRQDGGRLRGWTWQRAQMDYPCLAYNGDRGHQKDALWKWTGAISIEGGGQRFLLFSYLAANGAVGDLFLTSCLDTAVLRKFAKEAVEEFAPADSGPLVRVVGGDEVRLAPEDEECVVLPPGILSDIESQVDAFFGKPELFDVYGIPRRRGFLFVGPPGNGKSMLSRRLLRSCWRKYGVQATAMCANRRADEEVLAYAFRLAAAEGPGILIMEDLDSLLNQSQIPRAGFLAMLDGLCPRECTLILASTNNPGDIDPALVHRPSRFDRVWHFALPDAQLRARYLDGALGNIDEAALARLVRGTDGWSFAYLKELRATAAILSACAGKPRFDCDDVDQAYDMLAAQFAAGKRNHVESDTSGAVGFRAA